jgi:hypothetical protein
LCLTPVSLNVLTTNSCNLPILITPSGVVCALQLPAHNSPVWHKIPHVNPHGLSDKIVLAEPY